MQGFDSDATYCSQAEKIITQPLSQAGKADRSLFRNVRRSQRLLQQSSKNKTNLNWANIRYKMTQSPAHAKKMRQRQRSQSSTHFRSSTETDVCSQVMDLSKAVTAMKSSAESLVVKPMIIKQSIDLMAEFETQTLTNTIPLNQNHLLHTQTRTINRTTKDAAQIDLTQSSSNPICKTNTRGRPRKRNDCVIDLTKDAGKLAAGDGPIKRNQRKTTAKEHLCDVEPKIAKIDKSGLSSPTTSAFLLKSGENKNNDLNNNQQTRFDRQGELWNHLDTVEDPLSTAANNLKTKIKVDCIKNGLKKTKSNVNQSIKEKQIKNKRKISGPARTKAKFKNDMITKYVNLADFVEDNEAEKRRKRYQLHPSCPTNSGHYKPPSPMPTKPVPLLRSVANSVLPKVYPPHFIHQKPPIQMTDSITYEKTHVREMQAFRRTQQKRNVPAQQSPVHSIAENKEKLSMNSTPESMVNPAVSPTTKVCGSRVTRQSVTAEKRCGTNCLTPELSQSLEDGNVTTTTTSPSLPESLKGIFDSDDLREILNVDKVEYRLSDNHVKALAIVLNIRVENLREVLKNIVKLDQEVLKKIESAMKTTQKESNEKDKQDAGCFVRNLISPDISFISDEEHSKNSNARKSYFPNRRHRM